uniref:Uncharacterized protein n=1 Tax=Sphaerodactylus townsendi TaxID=933632 RepID=A0ACB8F5T1_9SAUR
MRMAAKRRPHWLVRRCMQCARAPAVPWSTYSNPARGREIVQHGSGIEVLGQPGPGTPGPILKLPLVGQG